MPTRIDLHHRVRTWRVYDAASRPSGQVFLIDRLWPRGVSKASLSLHAWLREAAPSSELRTWFGHDPARWEEFRKRYREELFAAPEAWHALVDAMQRGDIVLAYAAHDEIHNNAVVLQEVLIETAG